MLLILLLLAVDGEEEDSLSVLLTAAAFLLSVNRLHNYIDHWNGDVPSGRTKTSSKASSPAARISSPVCRAS